MAKSFRDELKKQAQKKKQKKMIAVRLPVDLFDELESLAKDTEQSVSTVIILALRRALNLPE